MQLSTREERYPGIVTLKTYEYLTLLKGSTTLFWNLFNSIMSRKCHSGFYWYHPELVPWSNLIPMSNLAQTPLDKPLMWMTPIWFNGGLVFISYFSHYCYMVYITTYIYIFSYKCLFIFWIIAEKKTKEPQKENISKKWNLTSPCIGLYTYVYWCMYECIYRVPRAGTQSWSALHEMECNYIEI